MCVPAQLLHVPNVHGPNVHGPNVLAVKHAQSQKFMNIMSMGYLSAQPLSKMHLLKHGTFSKFIEPATELLSVDSPDKL